MGKRSIKDCIEFAIQHDGYCLSSCYNGSKTPLTWQCKNGHIWNTKPINIFLGMWCPKCSHRSYPYTIDDCILWAKEKEGDCLSSTYINLNTALLWECKNKHQWKSKPSNILYNKTWCPFCLSNNNLKKDINYCIDLASKKDGYCLSQHYINMHTKLLWQCKHGHTWKATPSKIYNNRWCPNCSKFKTQIELSTIIKDILNLPLLFNYKGFDWLINDNGYNLEIDIWVPQLKLAIEYDGEQHFMPVNFGGIEDYKALQNYNNIIKRDAIKNNLIAMHSKEIKYFIRFSYKEKINKNSVLIKLKEFNVI